MKRFTISILAVSALIVSCNVKESGIEKPYITVDPTTMNVEYTSKTASVHVDCNTSWVLTRTDETGTDIDWVKVTAISARGPKEIQIKTLENPTKLERSAILTFDAGGAIAYLDITQAPNPNDPPVEEPDKYTFPMIQLFSTGRGMDIESGKVAVFNPAELSIQDAAVKGSVITFKNGLKIEVAGTSQQQVEILTASPSHTNPQKNAGFMEGFCLSNFSDGTITYDIPFNVEVSGKVRFIKGQRREKDDSYQWSTDGGASWNTVGAAQEAASDASWKYLDFEIPSDQKVEVGKSLLIRETVTYNASTTYPGIMLGTGIALVPQQGLKSSVPAADGNTVLFSDGFDAIIDAPASPLLDMGFMKSMASGKYNEASYTAEKVPSLSSAVTPTVCYSRPGFLQIGFADESQSTTTTKDYYVPGSYSIDAGSLLNAAGKSSADLTVKFKAAGLTTAFGEPCNAAPVLTATVGTVSGSGEVSLLMDSWNEYSFTVTGATAQTVLCLSSNSTATGTLSGKSDNRFFIDDIVVTTGGSGPAPGPEDLTLTFDFSTCPPGWPSGKEEYESKDHTEKTHPYVIDGVTYNFTSSTCLEIAETSKRAIVWGFDGTNEQSYYVLQNHRFFGLPPVKGYRLSCVKFIQACSTNSSRKTGITSAITKQNEQADAYVAGGEAIDVGTNGQEYTFNLSQTEADTRYYFAPTGKASGFASMTLQYKKVK